MGHWHKINQTVSFESQAIDLFDYSIGYRYECLCLEKRAQQYSRYVMRDLELKVASFVQDGLPSSFSNLISRKFDDSLKFFKHLKLIASC